MSLKIVCVVQVGNQIGMCLFNDSDQIIRSLLPMFDEVVGDVELSTNMNYYGDMTIEPNTYNMIIVELPKVKKTTKAYLTFNIKNKLLFTFEPSTEEDDIEKLKYVLSTKFRQIINERIITLSTRMTNAISKFDKL